MTDLMLLPMLAALLGERTNVTLYIILGIVAIVLVLVSIILKVIGKKK